MPIITKSALAAELGLSKGRISQYVTAGLPVRPDGKLDRDEALAWVKLKRSTFRDADKGATRAAKLAASPSTPPDADLDLEGERRRKLRLENDEKERRLIPDTVFETACDMLVGPALVDLLSLPARVTDDLAMRRRLEDEIDGIRTRHAKRLSARDAAAPRATSPCRRSTTRKARAWNEHRSRDPSGRRLGPGRPPLRTRCTRLWRPQPRMTPTEWAMRNRVYPETSGRPGPRDPYLTPYIVPFVDALESVSYGVLCLVCGSQMGKTDAVLDMIGWRLDTRPRPQLYVGPSKDFLTDQLEPRIMALLDEAATLRDKVARGKRMKKTRKIVAGVPLRMAWAGSPTQLSSDQAGDVHVDELDRMGSDVKDEGDPLTLVRARGFSYRDRKLVVTSTPEARQRRGRARLRCRASTSGATPTPATLTARCGRSGRPAPATIGRGHAPTAAPTSCRASPA